MVEVTVSVIFTATVLTQFPIELDISDTIAAVKVKIQQESGISAGQQIIIINNAVISDDQRTVAEFDIQNGSEIVVIANF